MSASGRRKGIQFERDVVNMLKDELGVDCKRVLDQYREGQLGDIVLDQFVIECKRYACKFDAPTAWWDQVWQASQHMSLVPILIYKFDRRPIQAIAPLYLLGYNYPKEKNYTAQMSWDTLMLVMREEMNSEVL